ncbi:helix-turn-helix transcriptional regulator [Glutamicibacter sp. FBE19]|uniref:helix-turn-helix domain-containing protein n=1 Tax=Glutamicibacter sp. FBE19 TaxID=2761534 RepID=UPI0019D637CC|nr:helix-turn-helix transcriptional regulator [Glutamicibacter sp. FBE19]MBF6672424.1 helix-turn-helix transcriptional regulator [Glutamicibacter sp. FBE19]
MGEQNDKGLPKIFGDNQKHLRLQKGWSQSELARHMQAVPGWEKYNQVAVSRTEEGERVVRLDEAIALSHVLETTVNYLISPPDSYVTWIQELDIQSKKVVDSAKNLNDAARSYENARSDALLAAGAISKRRETRKATKSLKEKLDKKIGQIESLANLNTFQLLDWIEDEQDRLDDEKFNDEI